MLIDTYPCTPLQAGMFYQQLMAPDDTHANEQLLAVLDGPLEVARMNMAWIALVRRHAIPRTRFGWSDDDQPCQCVLDLPPLPPTLETPAADAPDLDTWLDHWAAGARALAFDLEQAPPLRLALAPLPAQRFALLLTFHHILLDGRSYPGLLRELMALYVGTTLPPAAQGMKAYALWHREQQWDVAVAAWREYLKPATLRTTLPVANVGAVARMHPFRFVYSAEDTLRIERQCGAAQVSFATLLCAAWGLVLWAETDGPGPAHGVFGYTRCGRAGLPFPLEDALGLFINTVPVVLAIDAQVSAPAYLASVRAALARMAPYAHTPFIRIAEACSQPDVRALFDTIVVVDHRDIAARMADLGGVWQDASVRNLGVTRYLATVIGFGGERRALGLDIDLARIGAARAERWFALLLRCVEGLIAEAAMPLGQLAGVAGA